MSMDVTELYITETLFFNHVTLKHCTPLHAYMLALNFYLVQVQMTI